MADNVTTYDFDLRNSKKISEFKRRDTITKHQENSWLALAQYNALFGSYHNVAINLSAITGYSISSANANTSYYVADQLNELIAAYHLEDLLAFSYVGTSYDYDSTSYALANSNIGYNLISYANTYIINNVMWQYFPSEEETSGEEKYLYTEEGIYLLTDREKKISVK